MPSQFTPGEIWPDDKGIHINAHGGGVLLHDGKYYWFGEHKIAGEVGNQAHVGVVCYSSTSLYEWKNEGTALTVSDDPASEITKGSIIERPKVIYNSQTKQFVMWFHLELKGQGYKAARSGMAISDCVTGPYQYLGSIRPNAGIWPLNMPADLRRPPTAAEIAELAQLALGGGPKKGFVTDLIFQRDFPGGQMARDMTLFVDDDGVAYHIYASEENGVLQISQLTDDYLKPAGRYVRLFPGRFHEAPAIFKHHGKYWLITSDCTGWAPNTARLSVADSILGSWRELGNPCVGADAELTFGGQSTHILPVAGKPNAFIFMADRWRPENAIDGRYVWLPIQFKDGIPFIEWMDQWSLGFFDGR
jgi:hypothetical protein